MTICMHTIHSCQNTSRQYSSTNPTPCKPTHPQTHSFQPLSDSFNLSMDTPYNIPNGAMQHRQSMARYFVINLFFLTMILFIKEQQQFHFILNLINIINVLPYVWNKGFSFLNCFCFWERKKTACLWWLDKKNSDPQLIPDIKLLPHKIMTCCQ